MATESQITCHVCGASAVKLIARYSQFHRVTSDCKAWPAGGELAVCGACGCAQAVLDAAWHREAKAIYDRYTIYHQAKGAEQSVFDSASGAASSRSSRLLERLDREIPLPSQGRMLDIGCGNGALLRAFSQRHPGWTLAGAEVNDHYRSTVESIPRVERLFTCPLPEVPGTFRMISLMHALEHIPAPRDFIAELWDKLEAGGLLLIQVPDCRQNPFMFLVADHATHFFVPRARDLVASVGYEVLAAVDDWISKEITVVARKPAVRHSRAMAPDGDNLSRVHHRLDWLDAVLASTRALSDAGQFGIFGTSIAATWLVSELDERVAFFVDEDPNRAGQTFFGRPIFHPREVPAGSNVFIALPTMMAVGVRHRLSVLRTGVSFHIPCALPED